MKYILQVFASCFILMSCNHPEGKKYERNQSNKNEYKSSSNEININAVETEIQTNKIQEYRNVLKMEIQNGKQLIPTKRCKIESKNSICALQIY